jgi:pimeloyl-ACP methyl ester carboxylesterase
VPYVETRDGTRLFYEDWSATSGSQAARTAVLFTHGWPLDADMWEYQMPALVRHGHRCVAFDRRGFGRSDQPAHGYDFDTFADDLAAVLERLDLRNVTLVGFSMGGGEVTRYLTRHGAGRVARVALIGATLRPLDEAVVAAMTAALCGDRPKFLADGVPTLFAAAGGGQPVSDEMMRWIVGLALRASPLATVACLRLLTQTDFLPELATFTMPTLIVHGDADGSAPIADARATAEAIPTSRLVEYAGQPHGLFLTERDRLTRDLLAFAT